MKECRCHQILKLHGREGEDYALDHLKKLAVNINKGVVLYLCPITGKFWKKSFPHPEAHGDGPPDFAQIPQTEAKKEFKF